MKTCRIAILALSLALGLTLGFTAFTSPAHAQLIVQGKSDAARCYDYAARGNTGSKTAINTCTSGLSDILTTKDQAATYVNRGILLMRKGDQEPASKDFKAAIGIMPKLTEAYVNYGASLIRQSNYGAALSTLNVALEDTESPTRPDALYNRAVILDSQENYKGAYQDLKAALAIRPDWELALTMIDRYEVRPAG